MRLLLGDDQVMFLDALTDELTQRGHEVLEACSELDELVDMAARRSPELCVLGGEFRGLSALLAAATIRRRDRRIGILLLTGEVSAEVWKAYDDSVVDGIVNKACDTSVLDRAITAVSVGTRVIERFERPPEQRRATVGLSSLTGRETEILCELVQGSSTAEMALRLGIGTQTVRTHVQSVLRKLGVSSRSRAARLAAEADPEFQRRFPHLVRAPA